jgi:hypothetical protein
MCKKPIAEHCKTASVLGTRLKGKFVAPMTGLVAVVVLLAGLPSNAIQMTPSPLSFGKVVLGTSLARTEIVTNSGSTHLVLTGASLTGTGFSLAYHPVFPYTLTSGSYVLFKIRFASQAVGYHSGHLTVHYKYLQNNSWIWTSSTIAISGTGVRLSIVATPTSLSFGTVQLSSGKSLYETITNSGKRSVTVSRVSVTGTGYSFSGIMLPITLSAKQRATFAVTFRPQMAGFATGNMTISSNASYPTLTVPLSGTAGAPGQLAVTPSSVNFGTVAVGSRKTQAGSLSASNGTVVVSAVSVSGPEFAVSGIYLPLTLKTGATVSYVLTFAPSIVGMATAKIAWRNSNSTINQSVTGAGASQAQHSVTLSWQTSTSSNVVGYNVLRGNQSGGPYTRINTALITRNQDVDYNVQSGHTYYYVVTATGLAGVQSAYSNQVQAVIP